jgi:phage terminase small subunit
MASGEAKAVSARSARSAKMDSGIMAVPECHIPLGYGTGTNSAQPRKASKRKAKSVTVTANGHGLNDRQRTFVAAYLTNGFNATRAAMAAGHKCSSYSAFGVQGAESLKNPKVRVAINAYFRQAGMSVDEVVARLVEQATANPAQFFDKRWRLKRDAMKRKGHLVRSFKPSSRGRPAEIELHDAQAALVLIGKHLGMFSAKVQHVGDRGGPIQNDRSRPGGQPLPASNELVVIVWPHESEAQRDSGSGGNGSGPAPNPV